MGASRDWVWLGVLASGLLGLRALVVIGDCG